MGVTYPSGATFEIVTTPLDTVDYSDPVTGGSVPLVEVAGREGELLSTNFRVGELSASDGARYARIAVELVGALQRLRDRVAAPVQINSGYRHPALNATAGGATESQHMTGRAADIRSPGLAPLDFAGIALQELGCNIGIGLGQNYIHVDLRGTRASWVYPGAALSEGDFDTWVQQQCGG
jgi:hypothetical protein